MICYTCGHCSMHAACPFCGAKDIRTVVGFDPLDLITNPFGTAYQLGKDIGSGGTSTSSSSTSDGPSLWDRLPSIPNPFSTAYDAGKSVGDTVATTIKAPLDAVSSFMTVLKWLVIGGAVVGAFVLVYGVLRFVPVALGLAASNARDVGKMAPQLLAKAL